MSQTDAALLAAHVGGDPDAFDALYRRHRDRLWAVALRTCGNSQDAEDALQDALISALRNAGSFRGDAAVTTWLHRIVINACMDGFRRRKVRATDALPDEASEPGVLTGSDDALNRSETRVALVAALRSLPTDQRVAIVLVDIEGWSVSDAADILGIPSGTVKSRCSRGRSALAIALSSLRNPAASENVRQQADHPPEAAPESASRPRPHTPTTSTEEVAQHDGG